MVFKRLSCSKISERVYQYLVEKDRKKCRTGYKKPFDRAKNAFIFVTTYWSTFQYYHKDSFLRKGLWNNISNQQSFQVLDIL